tara:strand:- start:471 stop:680 length:210 start_codon:yes stop_codon:yes gene_type:complete
MFSQDQKNKKAFIKNNIIAKKRTQQKTNKMIKIIHLKILNVKYLKKTPNKTFKNLIKKSLYCNKRDGYK